MAAFPICWWVQSNGKQNTDFIYLCSNYCQAIQTVIMTHSQVYSCAQQARPDIIKEITHSVWNTGNLEWLLLKLKHGKYWVVDLGIKQSEICLAQKHNTWHPQGMRVTIITAQQVCLFRPAKRKASNSTEHMALSTSRTENGKTFTE